MSKKREMENYKQGMEAGAKAFVDKLDEHSKALKNVNKNFQHRMNCLDEVMDDVLDICEQQDERLNQIEDEDRYQVEALSDCEKSAFRNLMNYIEQLYDMNEEQAMFCRHLYSVLQVETVEKVDFDIIDQIENIAAQKTIFKGLCEVMFLEKESTEYNDQFIDNLEYFSINKRAREAILLQIESSFQSLGKERFVCKYKEKVGQEGRHKEYPPLEVRAVTSRYQSMVFDIEWDADKYWRANDRVYKSKTACKDAYAEVFVEAIHSRDSYLDAENEKFFGVSIVEWYAPDIERWIDAILDYVNVHKVRMDITELLELRDGCRATIKQFVSEEIPQLDYLIKNFNYYYEKLDVEESTDYADTLFGGMREVIVYIEGEYTCVDAADEIRDDFNQLIELVALGVDNKVDKKYVQRIRGFVDQINQMLGNGDFTGNHISVE